MFKVAGKKELLTDAVRQNPVLYDQGHYTSKDKTKKILVWGLDYPGSKYFFKKGFLKYN